MPSIAPELLRFGARVLRNVLKSAAADSQTRLRGPRVRRPSALGPATAKRCGKERLRGILQNELADDIQRGEPMTPVRLRERARRQCKDVPLPERSREAPEIAR